MAEYRHHQRHEARHLAAGKQVSHDRYGDEPSAGGKHALQEPHDQKGHEVAHHDAGKGGDDIADERDEEGTASAKPVRDGAPDDLRRAKAQHVGEDDHLLAVVAFHPRRGEAHRMGNLVERRQHDVDTEGV
jgi:hypothetical protein